VETETYYVTWDGESIDETVGADSDPHTTDELDDDVVLVTGAGGDLHVFRTTTGIGGAGYRLDAATGVLSVFVQRSQHLLRMYSPSGWWSIEGVSAKRKTKSMSARIR